ncbi:MAG TPA: glycosyltransferase [Opitutaceae bacterium]|jgi:glycosyltransferase involved in cell wall biosynthesis
MPQIRVTVAVITYNRSRFLRQTLAGLVKQDYPPALWELLVIDNNSTDDTADIVYGFMAATPPPRRILEVAPGLDSGRNRAVIEAKGDVIVLIDDDILIGPDWLSRLVGPFNSVSAHQIGVVGGEVIPVFPDGLPPWLEGVHRPLALRSDTGPLGPAQWPMGANFAFPRWVFAKLGNFDTHLDRRGAQLFGGGDTDMVRRVRAAGLEAWFVPGARVQHQIPASRLTFSYAARHAFDSARSRIVERCRTLKESRRAAAPFLLSRALGSAAKLVLFGVQAAALFVIFRTGSAKRAVVRAWRSCGYLYQIARSLVGKV